jgi:hypothetical protein
MMQKHRRSFEELPKFISHKAAQSNYQNEQAGNVNNKIVD